MTTYPPLNPLPNQQPIKDPTAGATSALGKLLCPRMTQSAEHEARHPSQIGKRGSLRAACRRLLDSVAPGLGMAAERAGALKDASPDGWEAGGAYDDRSPEAMGVLRAWSRARRHDHDDLETRYWRHPRACEVLVEMRAQGAPIPDEVFAAALADVAADDGKWMDPLVRDAWRRSDQVIGVDGWARDDEAMINATRLRDRVAEQALLIRDEEQIPGSTWTPTSGR